MLFIDHPFHFDQAGRTARTTWHNHIVDMICQFLLTFLSERVNRPADVRRRRRGRIDDGGGEQPSDAE